MGFMKADLAEFRKRLDGYEASSPGSDFIVYLQPAFCTPENLQILEDRGIEVIHLDSGRLPTDSPRLSLDQNRLEKI